MLPALLLLALTQVPYFDEGARLGLANYVNCSGAGITCTKSSSTVTITVPGGGTATGLSCSGCVDDSELASNYAGVGSCSAGQYVTGTADLAAPTCAQVNYSQLAGTVPNAPTATALAADPTACSAGQFVKDIAANGTLTCDTPGGAGGAPTDATYITQTGNATLSAEQALSGLSTGIMKVTTGTGVVTTAVAGDFPTLNQSTTGTAAALAANGANCAANTYPAGVDSAGAVESCTSPPGTPTTLTSTTLQSDAVIATYTAITGLSFTPAAATNYMIDCFLVYTSTAATTGISFAWDVPAAVTSIHAEGFTTTTATGGTESIVQRADNAASTTANAVITSENVMILHARLRNGANATTTSLGFTPETANSVSVLAGSTCQYWTY